MKLAIYQFIVEIPCQLWAVIISFRAISNGINCGITFLLA